MDEAWLSQWINGSLDEASLYHELIELHCTLTRFKDDVSETSSDVDYNLCLHQLNTIVEKFGGIAQDNGGGKKSKTPEPNEDVSKDIRSSNLYKLISRNYVLVLAKLTTKIYDVANNLLNRLVLTSSELSSIANLATIVLIDLFENYPNSLGALINFSVNQIYKILKKDPVVDSNLIYLLNSLSKYSTRADIDEKLQAKLLKIITKNLTSLPIVFDSLTESGDLASQQITTIPLKRNYMLVLRNISILSVTANYEHLLATSASTTSGAKMKPESIMSHQHQFQSTLLTSLEKPIVHGLSSFCKDVRIATVELLAHLFINFIPTGKFNSIEYLLSLYRLPQTDGWNEGFTGIKTTEGTMHPKLLYNYNEFRDMAEANVEHDLINTGIVESMIFLIQLEQFQNSEFITANMTTILELLLLKFSHLSSPQINHVQNGSWVKTLEHWKRVIDYLVKEGGTTCHDILINFVLNQFDTENANSDSSDSNSVGKEKKSKGLFSLKSSKGSSKSTVVEEIKVYHNSYQCSLILSIVELLLPFGIDFNSFVSKDLTSSSNKADEESNAEVIDDEKRLDSPQQSVVVKLLFQLLVNKDDYIRNYALCALLKYAKVNEVEVNQLVLVCFNLFNSELQNLAESKSTEVSASLDTNSSPMISVRLLSYSLALLALIKQTESIHLQNATIVKVLSFCTQSLKHNTNYSRSNNLKNLTCWIILSSLVTLYNDSEFVKLNSSQFLVFWKSLLTSQYVTSNLSGASEFGQEKEILDNLKLRNMSLICLLNYINTVDLTPESLKQIQFLLTKSYNYLTYLETNIDGVSGVTNFGPNDFNKDSFNLNAVSNLLFSNHSYNDKLLIRNSLVSSVLHAKKIIIKNFSKLATHLKSDINSSMIVFVTRLISDSKIFSLEAPGVKDKSKSSSKKSKNVYNKVNDLDPSLILLNEEFNYNFGVTSKFNDFSNTINELIHSESDKPSEHPATDLFYEDTFYESTTFKGTIESQRRESSQVAGPWFDCLEQMIFQGPVHSINYDPTILIGDDYSFLQKYSPNLTTSLVDLSIELFQLVFPYLTLKVQSSLLEQIRASLTSKSVAPLRYKAICVNTSITLHGVLNFAHTKKISFDKGLIGTVIDILNKIDSSGTNLTDINSDSIGLAATYLDKKAISEYIDSYVSSIINDTNPLNRGKSLLSMGKIYSYTGVGLNDVYNVAYQLLIDPNPVVYYYSLSAVSLLFDSNLPNNSLLSPLLSRVFETYLDDVFGYSVKSKALVNLKYKFNSIGLIANLLKTFITHLGPNLRFLSTENRQELKSLVISLRYTIGSSSINDNILIFQNLLRLLQELVIFDPKLLDDEVTFYSSTLVSIISKNLKLGLSSISATSLNLEAIFPFNSSFGLYKLGYACFTELIKVYGNDILTKEVVQLIWVSFNIKPCEELKNLIMLWMESSLELNWFATLNSLFKMSSKKLIQPYVDVNFQQKLLPLLQRQKKKRNDAIDFKDEEIENIVGDDGQIDDKNEPISWEFKLFIYDLLNHLLQLANKNSNLMEKLKLRISDLVKIAFLGSTSPINVIKLRGMSLLDKVLGLFGDLEDSMYTGVSILEQQQAQIISAIVPCFNSGSSAEVIVNAVNVSSKFINLPRIKFYSKQRILKTLIYFLEELSSNKFIRFGFLENMSEYGRKSIQVSILNCWALVRLNSHEDMKFLAEKRALKNLKDASFSAADATTEGDDSTGADDGDGGSGDDLELENELIETLDKYSTLLISLWIVSLKEFSTLKYNDNNPKELQMYNNYWINFISVLSLELEQNPEFVENHLAGDASAFFFILFSQCVESLIKHRNIIEVLVSLDSLVKNPELIGILFHDEILGEVVDLFDRLILIEDDTEVQIKLIQIIHSIFQTYFSSHKDLVEGFDKLFELIRLVMLPLFNCLPFLRTDFDANDSQTQLLLKKIDSAPNLVIIKLVFQTLVTMLPMFPEVVRVDLYSCLLFMIGNIYQYKNELLISTVLPYLQQIIKDLKQLNLSLVNVFTQVIQHYYPIDRSSTSSILTYMVLITAGEVRLSEADSDTMVNAVVEMLINEDTKPMGIQCAKSLIQQSSLKNDFLVTKMLIKQIVTMLVNNTKENQTTDDQTIDSKLGIELLMLFTKSQNQESSLTALYSFIVPLILAFNDSLNQVYLHHKLMLMINHNANSFKLVVNSNLSASQRQLTESLVKLNTQSFQEDENDDSQIQLKTFG